MPANRIVINDHFEYIIEDSKMEETLEYLSKVSVKAQSLIAPEPGGQTEDHILNTSITDKEKETMTPVDYLSNKYPRRGSVEATYTKTEVLQMLEEYGHRQTK